MKKLFLLLVLSLALFSAVGTAVLAQDSFTLFISSMEDSINPKEYARFNLTIQNNLLVEDNYNVEVDFSEWSVESQPQYVTKTRYGWTVPGNGTDSVIILLKPTSAVNFGTYKVKLIVTSSVDGTKKTKDAIVNVRPEGLPYGEYLPTLVTTVDLTNNGILDPRSSATVFINLDNYVPIRMDNLTVEVSSKIINRNFIVSLDPLERRTEQFTIALDPLEKPVDDRLVVEVFYKGESLKKVSKDYKVIPYSNMNEEVSVKKEFLKIVTVKNLTNDANVNDVRSIQSETGFITRFFSSTSPKADVVKEKGKYMFQWGVNLAPQQSTEIKITESYRGISLAALAVIVIFILYYAFRSPIVVQKEAKMMNRGEGGISELKVLLYIRNRSMKTIHKIKVLDKVPHIADMHEEVVIGTLRPSKILKDSKKGTLAEWDIPMLEGYEERIISYKIHSNLSILGFFNLPAALIKYRKNDKTRSVKSNRIKAALK